MSGTPSSTVRVDRVAAGEDPGTWKGVVSTFNPAAARTLKEDDGVAVFRATVLGRDVVLKRWDLRTLGARLKHMFGAGRAERHWRHAAWLKARGISTARCLALATDRVGGTLRRWLVMEHVDGATLLEAMSGARTPVKRQHDIAREAGRLVAEFTAQGVYNRDHKPSNLIVRDVCGKVDLAVIDCVDIRRGVRPERMLASLAIEPMGCGLVVRRPLSMRVIRSFVDHTLDDPGDLAGHLQPGQRMRTRLWRAIGDIIRTHGDPRPRVNPLGPR